MKALLSVYLILFTISAFAHTYEAQMPEEFQDEKFIKASIIYDSFHLEIFDLKSRDIDITGVNLKTGEIDVYVSEKEITNTGILLWCFPYINKLNEFGKMCMLFSRDDRQRFVGSSLMESETKMTYPLKELYKHLSEVFVVK